MRFLDLFRRRPDVVHGTDTLPEGHARRVDLDRQIVLCRVGGKLFALDARCPHEGGRLSGGPLAEGVHAVCPLHQFRFDARTGAAVGGVCADARTYRVRERQGTCEVWPGK